MMNVYGSMELRFIPMSLLYVKNIELLFDLSMHLHVNQLLMSQESDYRTTHSLTHSLTLTLTQELAFKLIDPCTANYTVGSFSLYLFTLRHCSLKSALCFLFLLDFHSI